MPFTPFKITPSTVVQLKQQAKKRKRELNILHSVALDQLAQEHGFANWTALLHQMRAQAGYLFDLLAAAMESKATAIHVTFYNTVEKADAIAFRINGVRTPQGFIKKERSNLLLDELFTHSPPSESTPISARSITPLNYEIMKSVDGRHLVIHVAPKVVTTAAAEIFKALQVPVRVREA